MPRLGLILVLTTLVATSGCTLFYPRFDAALSEQTTSAFQEIAQLTSAIELGKYDKPGSFDEAVDTYSSIDAKLATASLRATTLNAPTGVSRAARVGLKQQIEGCRARVKDLADIHKSAGKLTLAMGGTQPVLVNCDQAVRAADAMK